MRATILRRTRKRGGKVSVSRTWYARLKFDDEKKERVINLGVTDELVAKQKMLVLVRDYQFESAGLTLPKQQRHALQSPFLDLVEEFIADFEVMGRADGYISHVRVRLKKLAKECQWKLLRDVAVESFIRWRSRQVSKSAKTLNDYLSSVSSFFTWLCKQGRLPQNLFLGVTRVDARGRETFRRGALSEEQSQRLLQVAGERRPIYLVALQSGLRRGEINGLRWSDVHLDVPQPFHVVRAAVNKNRKQQSLPLHSELAAEFRAMRSAVVKCLPDDLVFPGGVPKMEIVRADFEVAGIPVTDEQGRLDFHSLRKTYITRLQKAGVTPREAMELARHSEMRLTMETYTDVAQLPLVGAIGKLPALVGLKKGHKTCVPQSQNESTQIPIANGHESEQSIENIMRKLLQALSVSSSPKKSNGGERGIRTPDTAFDRITV
jgi:integrase